MREGVILKEVIDQMVGFKNFQKFAGRINPFVVKRYLMGNGWKTFEAKRNDVFVLQYFDDKKFEQVVIPNNQTLSDYSMALYQAIKTISDVEGKSVEEILSSLLNPYSDIIKICVDNPGIEFGNIPFDAVRDLYRNVKKLIAVSVCDILHPRNYHVGCPSDAVKKFVSQCRFGQTEADGYVVPVLCPFIDANGNPYDDKTIFDYSDNAADSLTRKVTRHLIEGIYSIKAAVDTKSKPEILVSANFCDALAGICRQHADTLIEFHAKWSPAIRKNIPSFSSVSLDGGYIALIKALPQVLRLD